MITSTQKKLEAFSCFILKIYYSKEYPGLRLLNTLSKTLHPFCHLLINNCKGHFVVLSNRHFLVTGFISSYSELDVKCIPMFWISSFHCLLRQFHLSPSPNVLCMFIYQGVRSYPYMSITTLQLTSPKLK